MRPFFLNRLLSVRSLIMVAAWLFATPASALQPLREFVVASHAHALDNRESAAVVEQREAELRQTWSRLAPTITLTGQLVRNQYAAEVSLPAGQNQPTRTFTITPENQWDVIGSFSMPLVDVGLWQRIGAADKNRDAARARALSTRLEVERQVARAYYQTAASEAVLASARRALSVSEASFAAISLRNGAGLATDLDTERARAEVERNRGTVADAELLLATSTRNLETLSGLSPGGGAIVLETGAPDAPPADARGDRHPSVLAAKLEADVARSTQRAAWSALLPTLTVTGSERFTNAIGFGQSPSFSIGVGLTVRLDLASAYAARASEASAVAARVREERAQIAARDGVYTAEQQLLAQTAKARSAHAQVQAARDAATIARDRYQVGTATLLDSLLADRDSFAAEVGGIQADADLAYARAQLLLAQGASLAAP